MLPRTEPDRVLTYFGVFLGAAAVLYFGWEAIIDLSPLAKSFLLVAASAMFLAGSKIVSEDTVFAMYVFSAVSYLTFIVYYTVSLEPSSRVVFLLLGISGALFILIGRRLEGYNPGEKRLKQFIAVLAAVSLVFIAVDTYSPEPVYELEIKEEVTVVNASSHIGAVKISNPYPLPQQYEFNLRSCGNERVYHVSPRGTTTGTSGIIDGGESLRVNYTLMRIMRENATAETFRLEEVDSCPPPEEGTVHLVLE